MPVRPEVKYFLFTISQENQLTLNLQRLARLTALKSIFGEYLNELGLGLLEKSVKGVVSDLENSGNNDKVQEVINDPKKYLQVAPDDKFREALETFLSV